MLDDVKCVWVWRWYEQDMEKYMKRSKVDFEKYGEGKHNTNGLAMPLSRQSNLVLVEMSRLLSLICKFAVYVQAGNLRDSRNRSSRSQGKLERQVEGQSDSKVSQQMWAVCAVCFGFDCRPGPSWSPEHRVEELRLLRGSIAAALDNVAVLPTFIFPSPGYGSARPSLNQEELSGISLWLWPVVTDCVRLWQIDKARTDFEDSDCPLSWSSPLRIASPWRAWRLVPLLLAPKCFSQDTHCSHPFCRLTLVELVSPENYMFWYVLKLWNHCTILYLCDCWGNVFHDRLPTCRLLLKGKLAKVCPERIECWAVCDLQIYPSWFHVKNIVQIRQ